MKTILVPTDFSETAYNAAKYALALGKQLNAEKIVLYNAYQVPVIGDAMTSTIAMIDIESYKEISENGLQKQVNELQSVNDSAIKIETLSSYGFLINDIDSVCNELGANLIIMGITGASEIEAALIGSNTLKVTKNTKVPLVIVPSNASFAPLKKVLLTCDFEDVSDILPTDAISSFLKSIEVELHVLHVERNEKDYSSNTVFESVALETLLGQFNPQYHFINNENFAEAVDSFASANGISIVIVLPKKHTLLDSLMHKSHTKALAFHSHLPLLVVHE